MTDLIGFINLISGIAQIGIAFFVLLSDAKDRVKRYFFLSALFLGLWSLSIFFYSNPLILFDSTVWLKIVYTMAYCMTLGLILFARVYPTEVGKKFKTFFVLTALYMLVMTIIMWTTDLVVVSTQHLPGENNSLAVMGPLYFWYGLPEFLTAIYIVGYYIKQIKELSGLEKRQVQLYVTGGVLMLIPVLLFDFVFPLLFDNTQFYKYSTVGNSIWTVIVAYSILTTRFLDIKVVVGNILGTILKSIFVTVLLAILIFVIEPVWTILFSVSGMFKLLIASIVLTILFQRIFKAVEDFLVEKYVYSNYHPVKSLRILTSKNSETIEIEGITSNLLDLIEASFKTDFASVILFDKQGQLISEKTQGSKEVGLEGIIETLEVWRKLNSNRILVYSELKSYKRAGKRIIDNKRESILTFMEKNSIEIIFSLKEYDKFDGVVLVGQNHNRNAYTIGDIEFLDNIVQHTQISLVRAFLYLELQRFNQTLQQKVDDQTQELQIKVKQLQEARRKESDMIDIMGHELRTPATVVKLNVALLEKYIKTNPEEFKKYLDRIKQAVETEISLINTLLTSAKLEGNKIEVKKEKVDVKEEIEMSIHGHEEELNKETRLVGNISKNLGYAYADRVRVAEVLNNLIGNAIKYTDSGTIVVTAKSDEKDIIISVKDSGKGISKKNVSKLGEKFFRVDNYLESDIVRPGGTGLGLYITFRLVRLMGGEIKVESKVGDGSTFTFTLPKYKGQQISQSQDSVDRFKRLGLKK